MGNPPEGKYIFGTVSVSSKGQIVIPRRAREIFGIGAGDELVVLGDEKQGIALMKQSEFLKRIGTAPFGGGESDNK